MASIEVNDYTKERLKQIKKRYEEKYGKITWEQFMYLMTITFQDIHGLIKKKINWR